jgi:hypothetical protein
MKQIILEYADFCSICNSSELYEISEIIEKLYQKIEKLSIYHEFIFER